MEELMSMLSAIWPMSDLLVQYLHSTLVAMDLSPKQYILKQGQVSNQIVFIQKGILHCYRVEENGKESTKWLMDEGNVVVAVDSFFSRKPSKTSICSLEQCVLLGISYDQLQYAYRNFIEFNIHGRVLTERYYEMWDERATMFQTLPAPEKYEYTRKTQPNIIERVPEYLLASYLGMHPTTLSKVKKQQA
jgi:hypothetical protein